MKDKNRHEVIDKILLELDKIANTEFSNSFEASAFSKICNKIVEIVNFNKTKFKYYTDFLKNELNSNEQIIAGFINDVESIEDYIKENGTIIENKDDIEARYKEIISIKETIKVLLDKQDILNMPENEITTLQEKIKNIQGENDGIIKKYRKSLSSINDILSQPSNDPEQQLSDIVQKLDSNLSKINDKKIIDSLDALSKIETVYEDINNRINERIEKYNVIAAQINSLREAFNAISDELEILQNIYQKHILEDKKIVSNFTEKGEFKMESWRNTEFSDLEKMLDEVENRIKGKIKERERLPVCEILKLEGNTLVEK